MLSVLIIHHARTSALYRVFDGLTRSTRHPDEVVLCAMDEAPPPLPETLPFPVRSRRVDRAPDDPGLPLARARNEAARHARGDILVFLDVDCIPGSETLQQLSDAAAGRHGLIMAQVRYLPRGAAAAAFSDRQLQRASVAHPRRPQLASNELRVTEDYGLFWSLGFAVSRRTLQSVGGFDERYVGYGCEDTDFAFRARDLYVPLTLSSAPVYHQYHDVYRPPLNHFHSLVANAQRFFSYWRVWPMTGWLNDLQQRGYIDWSPTGDAIRILRIPTPQDVNAALCSEGRGF